MHVWTILQMHAQASHLHVFHVFHVQMLKLWDRITCTRRSTEPPASAGDAGNDKIEADERRRASANQHTRRRRLSGAAPTAEIEAVKARLWRSCQNDPTQHHQQPGSKPSNNKKNMKGFKIIVIWIQNLSFNKITKKHFWNCLCYYY